MSIFQTKGIRDVALGWNNNPLNRLAYAFEGTLDGRDTELNRAINLKQLAEQLQLSQTTVSRALNGYPEVSEKTRLRVQTAAREFNYRPSPSAATLATGKTRVIGHVVPMSEHRMINPHFSDFLAGASETYAEAGYDLLIRAALPEDEANIYRDFATRNRVDGVVVHGPQVNDNRVEFLRKTGLPFVVHGRVGDEQCDYSWLDVDNFSAFYDATRYLIGLGHCRIALINGLEMMTFARDRHAGYSAALQRSGVEEVPELMFSADMTEPYGYNATRKLLMGANQPTAILFSSILSALGGMRALSEAGVKPGHQVSVMTFDDRLSFMIGDEGNMEETFFTSMQSSIQEAGRRLGQILLDQIAHPNRSPVSELWQAKLVVGKTTSAPCG